MYYWERSVFCSQKTLSQFTLFNWRLQLVRSELQSKPFKRASCVPRIYRYLSQSYSPPRSETFQYMFYGMYNLPAPYINVDYHGKKVLLQDGPAVPALKGSPSYIRPAFPAAFAPRSWCRTAAIERGIKPATGRREPLLNVRHGSIHSCEFLFFTLLKAGLQEMGVNRGTDEIVSCRKTAL